MIGNENTEEDRIMSEVILFGEPMVMFVADETGDLADVSRFEKLLAGAEVNVAIGLRRLGHTVSYVTKLGDDPFGHYIEKKLNSEGLDARITYDREHFTGFQLKSKVEEGDPEVCYFRKNSAASHITEEEIGRIDFTGARILHITGIPPALSMSCRDATYRLIDEAKEHGMIVSFDPNLRPSLWETEEAMIRTINDLASKADLVLPGVGEGKILMGSDAPEEIAAYYRSLGAGTVIVKSGSKGAYVDSDMKKGYSAPYHVEKVVDTVGAGDGFAVGVLSAILEGLSIGEMASRGNAIGAIQVMHKSDNEGLPDREKLEEFMKEREQG